MGIKRKIKNYLYLKKNYPLSEQKIVPRPDKKTILIIDTQIPTYDMDSASNRLTEIAKFLSPHYNVYLMDSSKKIPKVESKKYIQHFNNMNVQVYTPFIDQFGIFRGKEYFLQKLLPKIDIVWLHRPEVFQDYINFFRKNTPSAKIIYDMVDIHFLRMERGLQLKFNEKRAKDAAHFKFIETELSKKADKIVVISQQEKVLMKDFVPENQLVTISNVHDVKVNPAQVPSFEMRQGIFFVGGFFHEPNVDAVEILYHHIMPLVWEQLPNLKITIIGSDAPEHILMMDSNNFQVVGFVENIIPYYENSFASVSPLRFGAGVKGKIGQALEYALPVVTTTIGAEGMFLEDGLTALISPTEDYQQFAKHIVDICTRREIWTTLNQNSPRAIYPFSIKAQEKTLFELLD